MSIAANNQQKSRGEIAARRKRFNIIPWDICEILVVCEGGKYPLFAISLKDCPLGVSASARRERRKFYRFYIFASFTRAFYWTSNNINFTLLILTASLLQFIFYLRFSEKCVHERA